MSKENMSYYLVGIELIRKAEKEHRPVLNVDEMTNTATALTSYEHLPREELERRLAKAEIIIALGKEKYRSVLPGEGYYVNVGNICRKEYADNLVNNAKAASDERRTVYEKLVERTAEQFPENGQYEMDVDGEDITIREGYTREKVLEMLKEDAFSVNE